MFDDEDEEIEEIDDPEEEEEFLPAKQRGSLVVSAPVGTSEEDFRSVVMGAAAMWSAYKVTPTSQGLVKFGFCSLHMAAIQRIMTTAEFSIAMGACGVPWGENNKLTPRQLACLEVVTNPHRSGTLNTRLKAAGVTEAEYRNWRQNPIFEAQYAMLTKDVLTAWTSDIDTALVQGAVNGKLENIKYVNELTGRHDPAKRAAMDVEDVLRNVVNIVQTSVQQIKDLQLRQDVINSIAAGVQALLEGAKIREAPESSLKNSPNPVLQEYKKGIGK